MMSKYSSFVDFGVCMGEIRINHISCNNVFSTTDYGLYLVLLYFCQSNKLQFSYYNGPSGCPYYVVPANCVLTRRECDSR